MSSAITPPAIVDRQELARQSSIRLPLPLVVGNSDYAHHEAVLRRMDEILVSSGVEVEFIASAMRAAREAGELPAEPLSQARRNEFHLLAQRALRCTVARMLSNESYRSFSTHLAESALLQWFCCCDAFGGPIRVPSKTTLQRMESKVAKETLEKLNTLLLSKAAAVKPEDQSSVIGLKEPVNLSAVWMDTTCAKLDIHHPVDWLLLRDGTRSIMSSIEVIRKHGLVHRMPQPATFVRAMNKLCIAMSAAGRPGRGGDKKKTRKATLRAMKTLVKKVLMHGQRYLELLRRDWYLTDLSQAQAERLADRLDHLLNAVPDAVKQAHERIIGERVVENDEKILSLYQPHAQVYKRGKPGAETEFGLQLLLSESADGLIVDCHLVPGGVANDSTLLLPAVERMRKVYGDHVATTVVADRGFASAENTAALKKINARDAVLPRSHAAMVESMKDADLRTLQRRRAQTEARIGIFCNNFLGDHLPTKDLQAQSRFVAWATLAHNFWVLARLKRTPTKAEAKIETG